MPSPKLLDGTNSPVFTQTALHPTSPPKSKRKILPLVQVKLPPKLTKFVEEVIINIIISGNVTYENNISSSFLVVRLYDNSVWLRIGNFIKEEKTK